MTQPLVTALQSHLNGRTSCPWCEGKTFYVDVEPQQFSVNLEEGEVELIDVPSGLPTIAHAECYTCCQSV